MKVETSAGNAMRLSRRAGVFAVKGEGNSSGWARVGPELGFGIGKVMSGRISLRSDGDARSGIFDLSSRSELVRLICVSARMARPTELALLDIFLTGGASNPAEASREFARSRSDLKRSLSAAKAAHCARCFSINFHNCEFCACCKSAVFGDLH